MGHFGGKAEIEKAAAEIASLAGQAKSARRNAMKGFEDLGEVAGIFVAECRGRFLDRQPFLQQHGGMVQSHLVQPARRDNTPLLLHKALQVAP